MNVLNILPQQHYASRITYIYWEIYKKCTERERKKMGGVTGLLLVTLKVSQSLKKKTGEVKQAHIFTTLCLYPKASAGVPGARNP